MAKYECTVKAGFTNVLRTITEGILSGSVTADLEDSSDMLFGDTRCVVRVFERYSFIGGNRLSLTLTMLGDENEVKLSAITSGGSQAMFFKINTFGEASFLDKFKKILYNSGMPILE